jgi:LCP family protein required for cell wall assembly
MLMNAATQRQLARAALFALVLLLIFPTILVTIGAADSAQAAGEQPLAQATATRRPTATPRASTRATATPAPTATPSARTGAAAVGATTLADTTNIVLLGSDRRPDMPNWRTDVLMVLSIDEANNRVGVISLPRDIYIDNIPGHNPNKINVVDYVGEQDKPNGGGPELLSSILEEKIGVPIHHYVRFNFETLKNLVDAMGGIEVNVDCPIYDPNRYDEGGLPLALDVGVHRLNGGQALTYVRSRYVGGDLDRTRRQQRFAWAVRDQIQNEDLLSRIPAMYTAIADSVQTDMSLMEGVALVRFALKLDSENVHGLVVNDPSMIREGYAGNMWVWYPNWDVISAAAQTIFDTPPLLEANLKDGKPQCP